MDQPIYCVFALIDGESKQVGIATDSLRDAKHLCRDTFKECDKKYPVKVVESKVVHDVVFALSPPSFHVSVCIHGSGQIFHYRNEDDFASALRVLISNHCRFDIVSHYD